MTAYPTSESVRCSRCDSRVLFSTALRMCAESSSAVAPRLGSAETRYTSSIAEEKCAPSTLPTQSRTQPGFRPVRVLRKTYRNTTTFRPSRTQSREREYVIPRLAAKSCANSSSSPQSNTTTIPGIQLFRLADRLPPPRPLFPSGYSDSPEIRSGYPGSPQPRFRRDRIRPGARRYFDQLGPGCFCGPGGKR